MTAAPRLDLGGLPPAGPLAGDAVDVLVEDGVAMAPTVDVATGVEVATGVGVRLGVAVGLLVGVGELAGAWTRRSAEAV